MVFHAFNNYCDQRPTLNLKFYSQINQIFHQNHQNHQNHLQNPSRNFSKQQIDTVDLFGATNDHLSLDKLNEVFPFTVHYKQFSIYDRMLCPSLLKRNTRFSPHIETSMKHDAITSYHKCAIYSFISFVLFLVGSIS